MKNKTKTNKLKLKGQIAWLYIKYQIISKAVVGILVLPFFHFITQFMINTSGRTNISSGDYIGFFTSLSGMPVILLGLLILILILAVDINTFIILSALVQENKLKVKIKDIFVKVFKSLKHFFSPVGALLVLFVAIVLPLLNLGISLGPLKDFAIPNFITSVIFGNTFYMSLYVLLIFILTIIGIIYIFTLHFVILDEQKISFALKKSRLLIKKYWKKFIPEYIWETIKISAYLLFLGFLFMLLLGILVFFANFYLSIEILGIFLLISFFELFAFFAFMSVPIAIFVLTKLFYKYNKLENKEIDFEFEKTEKLNEANLSEKIKVKTKLEVIILFIIIIFINLVSAWAVREDYKEIFKTKIKMDLIAHRGGGDLGAENTLDGIQKAIEQKAAFTEIDVQRTRDGKYIINHDAGFGRTTGVDKKPFEMTLEEIKKLKVKNEFETQKPAQPVATIEEVLDTTKGKIGVFVELKEKTADEKMADDVIAMIKAKDMLDECVILSLDYNIIKYVEKKYPEVKTGYLYFFSVGDLKNLQGDYLIMEEQEATPENIDDIHNSGKKAIVWTVNTDESIDKFIHSNVDGIITDHILKLKEAIKESNERTEFEIVIDNLIRDFGG
ncbi:hypothetical protein CSB11_00825 [Candidatus Campbellbacteria bacterium]|nr:MAG: hypothetical protein CSB11_00825 [Candidatus Campbellbacteria bacterium]